MSIISDDLTIKEMKKKPLDDLYGMLEMLWWEHKSPQCIDDIGLFVWHQKPGPRPEYHQFAEICDILLLSSIP